MTTCYRRLCWVFVLLALAEACPAQDNAQYSRWLDEMNQLEASSDKIIKEGGREAFIRRYREFIEAHPGFDRNIQLEMLIAQSYEWDVSQFNEAHDYVKAAEAYLSITRHYDPNLPEMPKIKLFAADRLADAKPKESADVYRGIIKDYPGDDAARLQCYWALGNNAFKRGNKAEAEKYFSLVMMYDETALFSPDASAAAQIQKANAGAAFLALAARPGEPAVIQLAALNELLKKYPAIGFQHPERVTELMADLQRRVKKEEEEQAGKAIRENLDSSKVPLSTNVPPATSGPAREKGGQPRGSASTQASRSPGNQGGESSARLSGPAWVGLVGVFAALIAIIIAILRARKARMPS